MGASRNSIQVFFDGGSRYTVVPWFSDVAGGESGRRLSGHEARWALGRVFRTGRGREVGDAYHALVREGRPVADEADIERMRRVLLDGAERGEVVVFEENLIGSSTFRDTDDAPPPPARASQKETTWIEFKIIDDRTNRPIPKIKVTVTLPDGDKAVHTTNGDGLITIDPVSAGSCGLAADDDELVFAKTLEFTGTGDGIVDEESEDPLKDVKGPFRLAVVEHHKVRTGETLDSLAKANGTTWQKLAKFNFGTDDPAKINSALRRVVGCTKRTRDKKNYLFGDTDDPGILFIPRKLDRRGFGTGLTHVLRVRPLARPAKPYLFSY